MSPFVVPEGPYSMDGIMDQIHRQVIEPEAAGEARPHETAATNPDAPRPLVHDGTPAMAMLAQIELMRQRQQIASEPMVRSHRPVVGIFTNLVKRVVLWGARPYINQLRQNQEAFNEAVVNSAREMALAHDGTRLLENQLRQEFSLEIGKIYDSLTQHYSFHANYEAIWQGLAEQVNALREIKERLQEEYAEFRTQMHAIHARHLELQQHQSDSQAQLHLIHTRQVELHQAQSDLQAQFTHLQARQESTLDEVWKVNGEAAGLSARFSTMIDEHWDHVGQVKRGFEELQQQLEDTTTMLERLLNQTNLAPFFVQISNQNRKTAMDQTRGSFEEIAHRQSHYVQLFKGRPGRILDLGCGRGELLHLLRLEGMEAWGADLDSAMLMEARSHGVHVEQLDALTALASVPAASLGGIFAGQVVEHLFPGELLQLLRLARRQLAPGGIIVLETINVSSPAAFMKSYTRDLDHKLPLHPEYLKLLLQLAGFADVQLQFTMPFAPEERMTPLPPAGELGWQPAAQQAVQERLDFLDRFLFGMQDYFVTGLQGEPAGVTESPGVPTVELRL